jgi:hypothetical protein
LMSIAGLLFYSMTHKLLKDVRKVRKPECREF